MEIKADGQQDSSVSSSNLPTEGEYIELESIQSEDERTQEEVVLLYGIEEKPPWCLSILLGFQQFLAMFGGNLAVPFMLAPAMCIPEGDPAKGYLITTLIFIAGIVTLLQITFGIRLPMVQGGSAAFLVPTLSILRLEKWHCPTQDEVKSLNLTTEEIWHPRIREIQGAIIVSSLFEIIVGAIGVFGLLVRFLTPLTIAPTVTLIGLSLFTEAADMAGQHWGISALTFALIAVFAEVLKNVKTPIPSYSKENKCHVVRLPVFKLFPVLLAVILGAFLCFILTIANAVGKDSVIRMDKTSAIENSPWFRVPYPGQWGMPTVSIAAVLGMSAAVIAGMIESIGDYYACANTSGALQPPAHAINRALMVEGVGGVLVGIFGTGNGTTTMTQNIAAISITRVASRRVIQFSAVCMIFLGIFGKFGAALSLIPVPVLGGLFCAMFSMIAAIGVSSLKQVDMKCSRNLFIFGSSLLLGLGIPYWFTQRPYFKIVPGYNNLDQLLRILLTTHMFIGGFIGFVLDNTIPGTDEERGLKKLKNNATREKEDIFGKRSRIYDLPCGMTLLQNCKFAQYIPFLPTFKGINVSLTNCKFWKKNAN